MKTLNALLICLGFRACEPVCPSGVNYGQLLEEARDIINQNKKHTLPVRIVCKAVFKGLFPHQHRMQTLTSLLGFYQRSGLQKVVPNVPTMKEMKNRPTYLPAKTAVKKRVAFFSGCLMDTMFMKTNDSTMKLLQLAGCEIVIPTGQACCGALHAHNGEKNGSKDLAKRNITAFEELCVDYIITNAGGCIAFLIDCDHLLKDELEWADRAKQFSKKLKDISGILVDLEFHKQNLTLPKQVITYQDSCHLRNVMKTSAEPRILLKSIKNTEYREMKNVDSCCGSAGIYNIVESEMSMQILDSKMKSAKATEAATIVTANPGCLLQMKLGIEREGLSDQVRAVHIADLLLEAAQTYVRHEII